MWFVLCFLCFHWVVVSVAVSIDTVDCLSISSMISHVSSGMLYSMQSDSQYIYAETLLFSKLLLAVQL